MLERVTSHWWVFLIRGLLSIVVGACALSFPGLTALSLAILFAAFAFVDGIGAIVAAVRMAHDGTRWGWLLFGGIVGVIFGAVALVFPGLSLLYICFLVAAWAIVTGIAEIASAIRLRTVIKNEWLWIIAGILSLIFGCFVLAEPLYGIAFVVYALAFYAFFAGVSFIALAFRLRARHATPVRN